MTIYTIMLAAVLLLDFGYVAGKYGTEEKRKIDATYIFAKIITYALLAPLFYSILK